MRGFVGVGSGMLMAPVFAILFGPQETVVMVILLEAVVTILLLPSVYKLIEWSVVVPMSIAATIFMPVGVWLLISVDAELMARGIAAVVLIFVLLLMTGWSYGGPKKLSFTLVVGSASGTLMAATSLGNPPVMLYLLSGTDRSEIIRANFTGYFFFNAYESACSDECEGDDCRIYCCPSCSHPACICSWSVGRCALFS